MYGKMIYSTRKESKNEKRKERRRRGYCRGVRDHTPPRGKSDKPAEGIEEVYDKRQRCGHGVEIKKREETGLNHTKKKR